LSFFLSVFLSFYTQTVTSSRHAAMHTMVLWLNAHGCVYMYVRLRLCVYVCVCVCACVCDFLSFYIQTVTPGRRAAMHIMVLWLNTHSCVYMCVCARLCVCVCALCVCMCVYICIYLCVCRDCHQQEDVRERYIGSCSFFFGPWKQK